MYKHIAQNKRRTVIIMIGFVLMIAALKKLQAHSQPMKNQNVAAASMYINDPLRKGFFNNLLSTHPPIEKRIERLENGKKSF